MYDVLLNMCYQQTIYNISILKLNSFICQKSLNECHFKMVLLIIMFASTTHPESALGTGILMCIS